jgi:hypothetical protein
MGKISGRTVAAAWFNPRDGKYLPIENVPNNGTRKFTPPTTGRGNDWILVLDDLARKFAPVGPRGE